MYYIIVFIMYYVMNRLEKKSIQIIQFKITFFI